VTAPLTLLFIGVGVDLTLSLDEKAKMQSAIDGAVLAAAINSDEEDFEEFGKSAFAANMSQTRIPDADIEFSQENGVIKAEASAPCMIALSPTGTGVNLNGGASLGDAGCEMHVHSQSSRAMTLNSRVDITMNRICVAGSGITNNSRDDVEAIETDCDVGPRFAILRLS